MSEPPASSPPSDPLASALIVQKPRALSRRPQRPPQWTWLQRWVRSLLLLALIAGAGGLAGFCLWTSAMVILRPHPPRWVAERFPGFSKGWGQMPVQTLAEIEAEVVAQQRYTGDLIDVTTLGADEALTGLKLLPIFETRSPCTRNCDAIVELRLYGVHHREKQTLYLQRLDQIAVEGPPEEQVLDPILHADTGTVGSTFPLPLSDLKPLYEAGLPGAWFTLAGRWRNQGSPILYGQLLHIDARELRLHSLLNWQSPSGRLPLWSNLDGSGLPELIVNQSVGLEPDFRGYTVTDQHRAAIATRLQAIALRPLPLPPNTDQTTYRNALFLAQNGLWSDAQKQLAQLKSHLADQWPQEQERQLQLITLHARISQTYADRDWSQPTQKLLALLLNGQWEAALSLLESRPSRLPQAILPLLERDSSRLWPRLTASLQLAPDRQAARLWGALLLLAKEDEPAALAWLGTPPESPLTKAFEAMVAQVQPDPEAPATTTVASSGPDASRSPVTRGLFGQARSLSSFSAQGWTPAPNTPELTLSDNQQWYEITVQAQSTGQSWRQSSDTLPEQSPAAIATFWQALGLGQPPALSLIDNTGETGASLQVQGVRWQGDTLKLLASGAPPTSPGPWIAAPPGQWQTPQAGSAQPFAALRQRQPEVGDRLLATLSSHLGFDATFLASALDQAQSADSLATVSPVKLGRSQSPDFLLTLAPQAAAQSGITLPVQSDLHLILSPQGELLYSDFWAGSNSRLMGWLSPPAGESAIVVAEGSTYRLLTWSQQRRFE